MASARDTGLATTLAMSGLDGSFMEAPASFRASRQQRAPSARNGKARIPAAASRAWRRASLASLDGALNGGLGAGNHHLPRCIVIGGLANIALAAFCGDVLAAAS
jgi:hypothetical protein